MTLALLLTAVTGAWATEFTSLKVGDVLHVGDAINTGTNYKVYGLYLDAGYQPATLVRANIGTNDITESETGAYYLIKGNNDFYYGIIWGDGLEGGYWPVTDTSDGISVTAITPGDYTELTFAVHEGTAEPPLTVEWNASTKTGTFAMPGSDVVLTPIYAKAAAFATTGTEPDVKTLLPEAAEGVIADTDAPLIKEGTGIVAFAGTSTTVTQGTLMYAVTPATVTEAPALDAADKWSADVPTAKTVANGGIDVLVWYYIQGADAPEGEAATLDNTFSDTEPACLTVHVLTNKFDIQLNAANANTIEAGKATVTVAGTAATVTDGKLQGVKMGSEVKLEAKPGYKFRKVEVKKGAAGPVADIVWDGTNVTDLNVESTYASYTKEGVKLSGNADQVQVKWNNSAYLGTPGMEFITMESGGFTFTAPTGKAFTKIEMKAQGSSGWGSANLGTGWAYNTGTVTWTGSAASTVKLLKDADMFSGDFISSIAFYLSE